MKGYVMDVQPFSVNDGDGIRTTIFLAGCPLRCEWCSNPEGFSRQEIIGWHKRKCIGCGECVKVCPEGIGIDLNAGRAACVSCGRCVSACPSGARVYMVRYTDADEVINKASKHRLFYSASGGGVTFSGGEATSQPGFLAYIAEKLYDMGFSLDIETSGYFDFEEVKDTLSLMDLIFIDLKIFDNEKHMKYTGVSNERILENISKLSGIDADVVVRVPVISPVNDDDDNIRRTAAFVRENLPEASIELLPYHEFGKIKYEALGLAYGNSGDGDDHMEGGDGRGTVFKRPSKERMEELKRIVSEEGVKIADFR